MLQLCSYSLCQGGGHAPTETLHESMLRHKLQDGE